MRLTTLIILLALLAAPAAAQNKYRSWSNPDSGATGTRGFADKLNKLIDEAEKSRAADPGFLRDLRDLARSAGGPRRRQVLSDDFGDGDFDRNPAWTVSEGRYWVEAGWGLRSSVTAAAEEPPRKMKKRDKALAILGAVLNQAAGGNGGTGDATGAGQAAARAAIHARVAVANAFGIEFGLSSWQPQGRFDIGPYQGAGRAGGYRLSYRPGGELTLLRVSGRGESVIARANRPVALEDKKSHSVAWNRDGAGRMTVSIDGKQVLSATDLGLRDAFQGVSISNRGGDYIIKSIAVFDGG